MKLRDESPPKSSFLAMEKDLSIITNLLLKNNRLKKLLYYTTSDALQKANLTEEQTYELFGKNIKIVPKMHVDQSILNYIIISFDSFIPNDNNPEFRDNLIYFDVLCNFEQWHLRDFSLRPYRIAAEIDSMIANEHLSGIGTLQFLGASQQNWNENFGGLTLIYRAIQGEEDKQKPLNPDDARDIAENWNEMFD